MKKVSFDELENTLTRTEMKAIMAGSGGDCQGLGQPCNTPVKNCCSGLVCASFKCQIPTD